MITRFMAGLHYKKRFLALALLIKVMARVVQRVKAVKMVLNKGENK